jgi:hypothetical protein
MAAKSPGKTLGKFWDFSGKCKMTKLQVNQWLRFGPTDSTP